MLCLVFAALCTGLASTAAVRVTLDPAEPAASIQRFQVSTIAPPPGASSRHPLAQNALDAAVPGSRISLYAVAAGGVRVQDGPLRASRSITVAADPLSPFLPSFDCLGRSGLLVVNLTRHGLSSFAMSGIRIRNGRSDVGGSLSIAAAAVRLQALTISDSRATATTLHGGNCYFLPLHVDCLRGGGAIFVDAGTVLLEDVVVRNATSGLSGGAIAIRAADHVQVRRVLARSVHAASFGGAISVAASGGDRPALINWTVSSVDALDASAGRGGGAVSVLASQDTTVGVVSVEAVNGTRTSAANGGVVSLLATGEVTNSSWRVSRVEGVDSDAAASGGAVALTAGTAVLNSTWLVTLVNATRTSAGNSGGAVVLASHGAVTRSSWAVKGVDTTRTKAVVSGGAVYLVGNVVTDCTWVVQLVRATYAEAGAVGGAVALDASALLSSSWSVDQVTTVGGRAQDSGGAVILVANNKVAGCSWSVTRVSATGTSAGGEGGAVCLASGGDVVGGSWTVSRVHAVDTAADTSGGAVCLVSSGTVSNSSWGVDEVNATATAAGSGGGAIALEARGSLSRSVLWVARVNATRASAKGSGGAVCVAATSAVADTSWIVQFAAASTTTAGTNGGAVALWAKSSAANCSFRVANLHATATRAQRGGALSVQARTTTNTSLLASVAAVSGSNAVAQGGGLYASVEAATRTVLRVANWDARNVSASEGALAVVSHVNASLSSVSALAVVVVRLRVRTARAAQRGGVFAVQSGRPYQIPWRTHDAATCHSECTLPLFSSAFVPLVYAVRLHVHGWSVNSPAAAAGALLAMDNTWATVSDVDVWNASTKSSGGLWSMTGYGALAVANVSATIYRASRGVIGLLLSQSESPGNISMANVSVRLGNGALIDAGTLSWVDVGALTPASLHEVSLACPLGTTFDNASLGSVQLTESPFRTIQQSYSGLALLEETLTSAAAFPYTATALGCRGARRGRTCFCASPGSRTMRPTLPATPASAPTGRCRCAPTRRRWTQRAWRAPRGPCAAVGRMSPPKSGGGEPPSPAPHTTS